MNPRGDACIFASLETICTQKSTSLANEEYKDSLEFNAMDKNAIRNNDDLEGELLDTVELDSLETTKIDTIKSVGGAAQFLPFAHIGTSWSNECATQNSTSQLNSSTNQNVEIETSNQTNDLETNNNITTKQSNEYDSQDLPGIK